MNVSFFAVGMCRLTNYQGQKGKKGALQMLTLDGKWGMGVLANADRSYRTV